MEKAVEQVGEKILQVEEKVISTLTGVSFSLVCLSFLILPRNGVTVLGFFNSHEKN
jgi:hypothetical protein